jgi:hypothetical protein
MNKNLRNILLITIALIVVVGLGYRIFEEKTVAPSTDFIDKTANWKTYRSAKYGFEFKYPPEYSLSSVPFQLSAPDKKYVFFRSQFTTNKGEIADDGGKVVWPEPSKNSVVENINGYNWQKDLSAAGFYATYSLRRDGLAMGFSITAPTQEDILRQIISTFQIVELPYERLDKVLNNLKIGNTFGPFMVSRISPGIRSKLISADNAVISFSGQATLKGHYYEIADMDLMFCLSYLDTASLNILPQLDHSVDYKDIRICFKNSEDFYATTGLQEGDGDVSVVIKNLEEKFYSGTYLQIDADFVEIISAKP